jgi:tetraacyldisaccharide 4'-kinase
MMRAPAFWTITEGRDAAPMLRAALTPLSWLYAAATARRIARAQPLRVPVPVISVGNLTAGGTGKTPIVRALGDWLKTRGVTPHVISRGYGGCLAGPVHVDRSVHSAADVGDEPWMLARSLPVWVGRDRAATAAAAVAFGAPALLLDDAHQNPAVAKDLSLVVVDAATGLGNGHVIPAGPLREPAATGLARADAIILMGQGDPHLPPHTAPVFRAVLEATSVPPSGPVVAFCGIGRPAKFEETLRALGADIAAFAPFPDHHAYSEGDLKRLAALSRFHGAALVTTEKDAARLPAMFREQTSVVTVEARVEGDLGALLAPLLRVPLGASSRLAGR